MDLKPCPFCGRTDLEFQTKHYISVVCISCGCEGPAADTREEAEDAWNERKGAA